MSSKSDFSYFSLIFDDKKVIESINIKRKALELVHQKENNLKKCSFLVCWLWNCFKKLQSSKTDVEWWICRLKIN